MLGALYGVFICILIMLFGIVINHNHDCIGDYVVGEGLGFTIFLIGISGIVLFTFLGVIGAF